MKEDELKKFIETYMNEMRNVTKERDGEFKEPVGMTEDEIKKLTETLENELRNVAKERAENVLKEFDVTREDKLKKFANRVYTPISDFINPKLFIALLIGLIVVGVINAIILLSGGLYKIQLFSDKFAGYKINKITGKTWFLNLTEARPVRNKE